MPSDRYSRQTIFPPIGPAGQDTISASRITIVGTGALGSVQAEMLARAGVGRLRLIDRDVVELSNLQRQALFTEEDVRQSAPKAVAAAQALARINSEISIEPVVSDLVPDNAIELLHDNDLILDGTDNFTTRFLINDVSVKTGIPWIYGACVGATCSALAIVPDKTPCFRCLFPEPPDPGSIETCQTAGILASAVHVVASFQVAQCFKLLLGMEPNSIILQADVWRDSWRTISMGHGRNPGCECCALRRFPFLEGSNQPGFTRLCGRNAIQLAPERPGHLNFEELAAGLTRSHEVEFNSYMMKIRVPNYELVVFPDGRAIIRGTDDPGKARALYATYIGT